ncbi:uncharacterized protein LOC131301895 [Rhododendron vialii]|uniref:uncharacterized protein LOC131301895 n=1 Tax=Rhododendron vialii TaxID=182163 RepID=UPI0026602A77|nr:uncharacterized protein LOC131301895 [Rhododendron vialii]
MSLKTTIIFIAITFFCFALIPPTSSSKPPHLITIRGYPNLYPESLSYDPSAQHFVLGSLRRPTLLSISDASVTATLLPPGDHPSLPDNSSFVGVLVDHHTRRLLAVLRSPSLNALAAFDLRSPPLLPLLFLTPLPSSSPNDVAVDFSGNAYVTDSANNRIWKITPSGAASVFSTSPAFTSHPVEPNKIYTSCGLNGIVYNGKGYLLVVQSNTGKMFKVNEQDGTARTVLLNKNLTAADGMAVRSDGVVIVVSHTTAYFIKSDSSWADGAVFDETALDAEGFASGVAVGGGDRVYVLYGHVDEGMMGNDGGREEFRIVEVESEKEKEEDAVWIYVMVGLGFAYFCFWRFQMRQLATNMNKKTA